MEEIKILKTIISKKKVQGIAQIHKRKYKKNSMTTLWIIQIWDSRKIKITAAVSTASIAALVSLPSTIYPIATLPIIITLIAPTI